MSLAASADLEGLSRETLPARTVGVLHRGGWGNPDVVIARARDREVVVKDYHPRPRFVRETWGRFVTAREIKAYRELDGHRAVPRLLGRIDGLAFAIEYRPGTHLSRKLAAAIPPAFVEELAAAIDDLHARGVVHLDLRHRSNVLVDPDGHPLLIDFASALLLRPRSLMGRLLLPLFARLDRAALAKWHRKLTRGRA